MFSTKHTWKQDPQSKCGAATRSRKCSILHGPDRTFEDLFSESGGEFLSDSGGELLERADEWRKSMDKEA
jgi:hypothetical protein